MKNKKLVFTRKLNQDFTAKFYGKFRFSSERRKICCNGQTDRPTHAGDRKPVLCRI